MKIVLATRNRKKVEEIRRITKPHGITLLSLSDFPDCPEVVEDGTTFEENATKKASEVARFTGLPALADDSGLVVDALHGEPGVHSARYAGEGASDQDNLEKVLRNLEGKPLGERSARFVCVLAHAKTCGGVDTFIGAVEGVIGEKAQGDNGFGYDPVFIPDGYDRTFAQMRADEKDALSHRGRALAHFEAALRRP